MDDTARDRITTEANMIAMDILRLLGDTPDAERDLKLAVRSAYTSMMHAVELLSGSEDL
jgi:hypothetical protein